MIMLNGETARSLPLRGWRASLHPPGIPPGPATVPAVAPSHHSGALRAGWQGRQSNQAAFCERYNGCGGNHDVIKKLHIEQPEQLFDLLGDVMVSD